MRRGLLLAVLVLGSIPGSALAAETKVDAAGNPFLGGLAFAPTTVDVTEGDTVTWTNTDILVPHTATEDHGLFNLSGTYPPLLGGTAFPAGFGPGESRSLTASAGTFHYFCEVHPEQMRGVISSAMRLSQHSEIQQAQAAQGVQGAKRKHKRKRRHRKRGGKGKKHSALTASSRATVLHYIVTATWASAPVADRVFDVEEQIGSGPFVRVADGTTALQGDYDAGTSPGTTVNFRARMHRPGDDTAISDWSPLATIVTG